MGILEAIRRLKIEKDDPGLTGYPDRPGEPDCLYYLKTGMCGYGNTCRFNHPTYNGQVTLKTVTSLELQVYVSFVY